MKYAKIWRQGTDPGVDFIPIDPPLAPDEVEIEFTNPGLPVVHLGMMFTAADVGLAMSRLIDAMRPS